MMNELILRRDDNARASPDTIRYLNMVVGGQRVWAAASCGIPIYILRYTGDNAGEGNMNGDNDNSIGYEHEKEINTRAPVHYSACAKYYITCMYSYICVTVTG